MFRKLLVPLDRSPLAEQAIGQAAAIARASQAELDLVLVHQPLPFAGFGDAPWNASQLKDEERYLDTIAAELSSGASIPVTHAVLRGNPVESICQRAHDVKADVVVMTSHGRSGFSRAWLGSVADGVIRRAAIPVLMLRAEDGKKTVLTSSAPFKRILVPLDGSALSLNILPSAIALARGAQARLILLRVVQPVPLVTPDDSVPFVYPFLVQDDEATNRLVEEARHQLAEEARKIGTDDNVVVETHTVVAAHVAQAIMDFAKRQDADAIAMSTHGRGASRLLMGSVADKVLRASGLPMLLHRPAAVRAEPAFLTHEVVEDQLPALAH